MKRKIFALLTVVLIISLAGCASKPKGPTLGEIAKAQKAAAISSAAEKEEPKSTPEPEETEEPTPEPEATPEPEETEEPTPEPEATPEPEQPAARFENGQSIGLDPNWEFASYSVINSGTATFYLGRGQRKGITVGVNAGHGTSGVNGQKTYSHPDQTPKVTGGTNGEGAVMSLAISSGMTFNDGTPEKDVTLREAQIFKEMLLDAGYDVIMIRDSDDVQLDNIARTVICNNTANCHISIHWDGDGLNYDKGCYCMTVPDGIKGMYPTSTVWEEDNRLGMSLVEGLRGQGRQIFENGNMDVDLTQTSYSSIPSIDIELGNQSSEHGDETLNILAQGLLAGVNAYFGQ